MLGYVRCLSGVFEKNHNYPLQLRHQTTAVVWFEDAVRGILVGVISEVFRSKGGGVRGPFK